MRHHYALAHNLRAVFAALVAAMVIGHLLHFEVRVAFVGAMGNPPIVQGEGSLQRCALKEPHVGVINTTSTSVVTRSSAGKALTSRNLVNHDLSLSYFHLQGD